MTIKRDATAPTDIAGAPGRPADSNGWYNHAVTITFTGQDTTSGIASCTNTSYSGPDAAAATVSGRCSDTAGNSVSGATTLAYDATAPTVTYAGNAETYRLGDTVTISCTATDSLSGVATTDCQEIDAPAYTFARPRVNYVVSATIAHRLRSCTDVPGLLAC